MVPVVVGFISYSDADVAAGWNNLFPLLLLFADTESS